MRNESNESNEPMSFLLTKLFIFFRLAAVCSCIGAATTAYLMLVPLPAASTVMEQALLSTNIIYLSKLWMLFFHPQFNFIAVLGCGLLLVRNASWQVLLATLFMATWSYTELSQQAFLIDALNQYWRPAYMSASSVSEKSSYDTILLAASGISDSQYFVVIYCFGMGSVFLGWAFLKSNRLGRFIGLASILIGIFSLMSFGSYYLKMSFLSPIIDIWYEYIYLYMQPILRLIIGWWLLLNSQEDTTYQNRTLQYEA